jgi:hypothetical protein
MVRALWPYNLWDVLPTSDYLGLDRGPQHVSFQGESFYKGSQSSVSEHELCYSELASHPSLGAGSFSDDTPSDARKNA